MDLIEKREQESLKGVLFKMSVFETLNKINVNDKVEEKNGLSYLSWAYAWAEVKKIYPQAKYTIYENAEGWNYFTDGRTGWVKTGVTIEELEHIEYLPIMDFKNKSIKLENITSYDVNKAIQRSLTKALARHGLGLYIYAGEDLPEGEAEQLDIKAITKQNITVLQNLIKGLPEAKAFYDNILATYNIKDLAELNSKQYAEILMEIKKLKGE